MIHSFLLFPAFPAFGVRAFGVRAFGFVVVFTTGFLSASSNGGNLRRSNNYIFVVQWNRRRNKCRRLRDCRKHIGIGFGRCCCSCFWFII